MNNPGLYIADSTQVFPGTTNTWKRTSVVYNGETIITTSSESDKFGPRSSSNSLVVNGETVAVSQKAEVLQVEDTLKAGKADLLGHDKCINITLANYNKLLKGDNVEGYKAFDQNACYRIVSTVNANTAVVDRPVLTDVHDPLYNNKYGYLKHNQLTSATYTNSQAPHLSIHGNDFEIEPGGTVHLTYMVDTHDGDKVNRLTIGDTFTTIVKDREGNVLYKNTTYAGVFTVELAPFMTGNKYTTGETWFSVECIDNHGVGSITHFCDVYIREVVEEHPYEITPKILADYGIVTDNNDPVVGYLNKKRLIKLFADVAASGEYTGVKMYNSGNTTYYIDMHINRGSSDEDVDLGSCEFYLYHNYLDSATGSYVTDVQEIKPGANILMDGVSYPVDSSESALEYINRDGSHIYRVGGTGSNKDKIYVDWREDGLGSFDSNTEEFIGFVPGTTGTLNNIPSLRTYRKAYIDGIAINKRPTYCYVARNGYDPNTTKPMGDGLLLPDHFTLDLNGSTIRQIECFDLWGGVLIKLDNNFDTHIKNGNIEGFFDNRNSLIFKYNKFINGIYSGTIPYEGMSLITLSGSRHCTFKSLDISRSLCYESRVDSREASRTKYHTGYGGTGSWTMNFDTVGYIDGCVPGETGVLKSADPLVYNASMEPRVSDTADISLVCTSEFIECADSTSTSAGFVQFPNEFMFDCPQNLVYGCGKHRELFVTFYDENKRFINAVKTELNIGVRKPANAKYMRLSGYGFSKLENGIRTIPTITMSDGSKRPVAFEALRCTCFKTTRCIRFVDCHWHNTRSIGFYVAGSVGVVYERCRWSQISNLARINWFVTFLWGDFEEAWQYGNNVLLRDCSVTYTPEFNEQVLISGHYNFQNRGCKNLTVINTDGIGFTMGNTESAYVTGCNFYSYIMTRKQTFEHPVILFRNNRVTNNFKLQYNPNKETMQLNYATQHFGTMRINLCDDPIVTDVALLDTFANGGITVDSSLSNTVRRSKIGSNLYS